MKLSFSTLGCPEWQWNDIYATARDLGYDGVEIRGIGREMFAPKMSIFSRENIEKTKKTIEDAGLCIPLFTTAADEERAGLGFAVMQSFCDKVRVTSTVGKGTTVTLEKLIGADD